MQGVAAATDLLLPTVARSSLGIQLLSHGGRALMAIEGGPRQRVMGVTILPCHLLLIS